MRNARLVLILAGAYALSYLAIGASTFIDRRDYDLAFSKWYKNPTTENEIVFRKEQAKSQAIRAEAPLIGALVVVSLGYGIYAFSSKLNKSR
jgi:hypothetical protein